jgi:hypothetical protein
MSNRAFVKAGGVLAILSALLYVGTMVTNLSGGSSFVYGWLGLLATILFIPMTVGFYQFLRVERNQLSLQGGAIAYFVGAPFVAAIYILRLVDGAAGPFLAEASAQATSATQPILDLYEAVNRMLGVIAIDIGSAMTLGVGGLLIALASLRTSVVPRWLGWLGVVAGVWGFLWLLFGWTSPTLPLALVAIVASVGMILALVWQFIMGVLMLRDPAP